MIRSFELACVFSIALAVVGAEARAALCEAWSPAVKIGTLDPKKFDEASGLAVSRKYDVLYHNNDSGTGPMFWVTARDGSGARAVKIKDYVPIDPEEIGMGPCPVSAGTSKTCVILSDAGDNFLRRKQIAFFFIEELPKFPEEITPVGVARFRYPDGPHDAEAMAVLPNHDLVIVTKEGSLLRPTRAAVLFRARASEVEKAIKGEVVELTKVGTIDVPEMLKDKGAGGLVTAMSVTSDGSRFVLLTYTNAIEIEADLTAEKWTQPTRYHVIGISPLQGQESVSYDRNERDILYSTEQVPRLVGKDHEVPLMKASCTK